MNAAHDLGIDAKWRSLVRLCDIAVKRGRQGWISRSPFGLSAPHRTVRAGDGGKPQWQHLLHQRDIKPLHHAQLPPFHGMTRHAT